MAGEAKGQADRSKGRQTRSIVQAHIGEERQKNCGYSRERNSSWLRERVCTVQAVGNGRNMEEQADRGKDKPMERSTGRQREEQRGRQRAV